MIVADDRLPYTSNAFLETKDNVCSQTPPCHRFGPTQRQRHVQTRCAAVSLKKMPPAAAAPRRLWMTSPVTSLIDCRGQGSLAWLGFPRGAMAATPRPAVRSIAPSNSSNHCIDGIHRRRAGRQQRSGTAPGGVEFGGSGVSKPGIQAQAQAAQASQQQEQPPPNADSGRGPGRGPPRAPWSCASWSCAPRPQP